MRIKDPALWALVLAIAIWVSCLALVVCCTSPEEEFDASRCKRLPHTRTVGDYNATVHSYEPFCCEPGWFPGGDGTWEGAVCEEVAP